MSFPADKLILCGLPVRTVIGTLPHERTTPQNLELDLELSGDFRKAGKSDDLADTFDYTAVERLIVDFSRSSSFLLLEAYADHLAQEILAFSPLITGVKLRITKPRANILSRSVSIEITRGAF